MHHVSPRAWMILGILFTFAVSQWPSGYTEPGEQGCQGFIWVRNQGKSLQQRQWGKESFASIRFSCSQFLGAIQSLAAGCKKVGPPHWATLMRILLVKNCSYNPGGGCQRKSSRRLAKAPLSAVATETAFTHTAEVFLRSVLSCGNAESMLHFSFY